MGLDSSTNNTYNTLVQDLDHFMLTILLYKLSVKLKDIGSFTIHCRIKYFEIEKVLLDLGATINLMLYFVNELLQLGELKETERLIFCK